MTPDTGLLADLLVTANERGPETLVMVDRLLRDTYGPDVVQTAHRQWTDRLRGAVLGVDEHPAEGGLEGERRLDLPDPVFRLLRGLRDTAAGRR